MNHTHTHTHTHGQATPGVRSVACSCAVRSARVPQAPLRGVGRRRPLATSANPVRTPPCSSRAGRSSPWAAEPLPRSWRRWMPCRTPNQLRGVAGSWAPPFTPRSLPFGGPGCTGSFLVQRACRGRDAPPPCRARLHPPLLASASGHLWEADAATGRGQWPTPWALGVGAPGTNNLPEVGQWNSRKQLLSML